MSEWLFLAQAWFALAAGLLLVAMGLLGRIPSGFSLSLVGISQFGLVVQLGQSIGLSLIHI